MGQNSSNNRNSSRRDNTKKDTKPKKPKPVREKVKPIQKGPEKSKEDIEKELKELREYKCEHELNDDGSVTFKPTPNCETSEKRLPAYPIDMDAFLLEAFCKDSRCYSDPDTKIVQEGKTCSFLIAALRAWAEHYPFRFRPEHIWLLVLQA